jgi:hypothetical protein
MNANRLVLCFLSLVCACDPKQKPPELKEALGVDLSSARGLAISASSASGGGLRPTEPAGSTSQLLVLDTNDQFLPVDLTTGGSGNPAQIYDTPKAVLIVVRDVSHEGQSCGRCSRENPTARSSVSRPRLPALG